jgi:FkbM family methyltransferase
MRFEYFQINEGDTVVNLGAHRGGATKFYSSKVGVTGKVFSIEPEKNNYNALCHATRDLYNVYIYNVAIGDITRMGTLHVGTKSDNHSTVRKLTEETQDVKIITWNDFVTRENITEVNLAKVDVEGSEIQWLNGMTHTFPSHIIMEEHSRLGTYSYKELTDLVEEKGYMFIRKGIHLYATR